MKISNIKKLLTLLAFLPLIALANESEISITAPINPSDKASLQRGAHSFVNYCLNCHSAKYMRYNRLMDIGLTEKQIKDNLLFAGEKVGDTMQVSIDPVEAKKWFGVTPPDLSVEVRARGADWVYAYMRGFYRDSTTPTGWNNTVYPKVAMPHVLYELQGEQVLNHETHQLELLKPGKLSPSEYNAFVADLTNYMAFMAEPGKQSRKHMGWWVLLFLGVLLVLAKKLKTEYWKDIK
ncbi:MULTISPECIES: cytochrome c1 [Methylotenera]|uniref:cytochrome c1 n=1 Tax=Methylotenera TaxID=359407 RepID=UPI0003648CC8|nr:MULTISPECIES: cytochrome c1 [Methylotenera]